MGMYTECIIGCRLNLQKDRNELKLLEWLLANKEGPISRCDYPENYPFSKDTRIAWMFNSSGSFYFGAPSGHSSLTYNSISKNFQFEARFNIKNYDNDIETFLAWLFPFIEQGSGTRHMYAIVTYEEVEEPTIYYLNPKEKM